MDFSRKLLEIKILSDNICDGFCRKNIGINEEILFLTHEYGVSSPSLLISKLRMAKSNVALACSSLLQKGLLSVFKDDIDKRQVHYKLTEKGERAVLDILQNIENFFREDEKTKDTLSSLEKITAFLNRKV